MEEIKVSEMLQADSINKDDSVMIIQEGVNKKAGGSIQTATGTSLSLTSVADTCKVTSNSKNLFDGKVELGTYSDTGTPSASSTNYRNVNEIKVEPETIYTFSINGTSQKYAVYYYDVSGTFISAEGLTTGTFTTPANCAFINFRCFNADFTSDYANLKIQLEEGSTASTYYPYNTEVTLNNGTDIQSIVLTPQEEKYAFTYDTETTLTSNGSVTIEYNTQSRLLNNDDTTAIKEYVDGKISIDEYKINLSYTTIASTYQFFKSNGIATITAGNIWIGASLSANSWLDIGTIPSACIPKIPITFSTAISDGYNGRVISYGKGSVTTDGKIRVMVSSALTSQNTLGLNFSVTYLT